MESLVRLVRLGLWVRLVLPLVKQVLQATQATQVVKVTPVCPALPVPQVLRVRPQVRPA